MSSHLYIGDWSVRVGADEREKNKEETESGEGRELIDFITGLKLSSSQLQSYLWDVIMQCNLII